MITRKTQRLIFVFLRWLITGGQRGTQRFAPVTGRPGRFLCDFSSEGVFFLENSAGIPSFNTESCGIPTGVCVIQWGTRYCIILLYSVPESSCGHRSQEEEGGGGKRRSLFERGESERERERERERESVCVCVCVRVQERSCAVTMSDTEGDHAQRLGHFARHVQAHASQAHANKLERKRLWEMEKRANDKRLQEQKAPVPPGVCWQCGKSYLNLRAHWSSNRGRTRACRSPPPLRPSPAVQVETRDTGPRVCENLTNYYHNAALKKNSMGALISISNGEDSLSFPQKPHPVARDC